MPRPEPIHWPTPPREIKLARFGTAAALHQQDLDASYERGRHEAERQLGEQLIRQRAELMEVQTGVLQSLREAVTQVARDAERALVQLALEAAQKFVSGLPITPEMLEGVIKEACAAVEDTADLVVLLHPEDLALLERANAPILLPQGGRDRLRFQASPQVSRGGCVVQTHFGVLDARRETKAELIQKAVLT